MSTKHLLSAPVLVLLLFSLTLLPSCQQENGPEAEFVSLFNGRDLSGWRGDSRLWTVVDGVIVGSTEQVKLSHNSFLSTRTSYSDFVLRVSVKLQNGNSGIQFRGEQFPDYVVKGYQADVAVEKYFGMLYDEGGRGIMEYWKRLTPQEQADINSVARLDDWNLYEIHCQDDRIKMILNGQVVCETEDPEGASEGIIALQLHTGDPMQARFKDIEIKDLSSDESKRKPTERAYALQHRFTALEGFEVETVVTEDLLESVVNLSFDHLGRPVVAFEHGGIHTLIDDDDDGKYESMENFSSEIQTAHGIHFLGPGDLLVNSKGPKGSGLYRLRDLDRDNQADEVELIAASRGQIGEHGPHAIRTGFDGSLYVMYGNHSYPDVPIDPESPSRGLKEDHLLERYLDPRGHANTIWAPAGTLHRLDLERNKWSQINGGFRNAFDFDIDDQGELFTFDSDMEWDFGLPWYRPIRVLHCTPGADYGWRTGSGKFPEHYPETLPGIESLGRGSPVGIAFYHHDTYPEKYQGALFLGDWSRGRIRVSFPEKQGASYSSSSIDFVQGQPLNVTDLDIGPDGLLYFSAGGRSTTGGLYRVAWKGADRNAARSEKTGIAAVLEQPMHRSAWARHRISTLREELGMAWETGLLEIVQDMQSVASNRVRALELLQVMGPQPDVALLSSLAEDRSPEARAAAVLLLGTHSLKQTYLILLQSLDDSDPLVIRRACESLLRNAPGDSSQIVKGDQLSKRLFELLDHPDRFVRYAARLVLQRLPRDSWTPLVLADSIKKHTWRALEGLLAMVHTQTDPAGADAVFERLTEYSKPLPNEASLFSYLRICQLALIRSPAASSGPRHQFISKVGPRLLKRYPSEDHLLNRELELLLAYLQPPGSIEAMLDRLDPECSQEDEINTVYALREIGKGWNAQLRRRLVDWFDRGREMAGAASMAGFVENLWQDTLTLLEPEERSQAEGRKKRFLAEQARRARELMTEAKSDEAEERNPLGQMSLAELSGYLELDPMSYEQGDVDKGRIVFRRAKCANCHVFGKVGRGGGPDLSTAVKRFRRGEILESIMYPSRVISDQYTGVVVDLKNNETVTGMVAGDSDSSLILITASGERIELDKKDIVDNRLSQVSIMPEDLLDTMGLSDLVDLFAFLERGSAP